MFKYLGPKFIVFSIVIVFVFVVGVVLAYQYYFVPKQSANSFVEAPKTELLEVNTKNWTTYKNNDLGFEFKYPKDFFVFADTFAKKEQYGVTELKYGDGKYYPRIFFAMNWETYSMGFTANKGYKQSTNLYFNGNNQEIAYFSVSGSPEVYSPVISIKRGNDTYNIIGEIQKDNPSQEKIFKEIISTFKFIEKNNSNSLVKSGFDVTTKLSLPDYTFLISREFCDDPTFCFGQNGEVEIIDAKTKKSTQTIKANNLSWDLAKLDITNNEGNTLYGYFDSGVIIMDDFNFDNLPDFAVSSGHQGSYGAETYDIHLYDKDKKAFVFSQAFSDLTHELGMFFVNKEKQEITTYNKSGCCYHETTIWKLVNNIPQKIYILEEGEKTIEKKLVDGKWIEKEITDPVIYYISPSSGITGGNFIMTGKYFNGFEGDLNLWIENSNGIKGIIYGDRNTSNDNSINFILPTSVCQQDMSYIGLPCPADKSWTLTPGKYKIFVRPWSVESNKVDFTIK